MPSTKKSAAALLFAMLVGVVLAACVPVPAALPAPPTQATPAVQALAATQAAPTPVPAPTDTASPAPTLTATIAAVFSPTATTPPSPTPAPAVTSTPVTSTLATPDVDVSGLQLTLEDLPAGFETMSEEDLQPMLTSFKDSLGDYQPLPSFGYLNARPMEVVVGFGVFVPSRLEQVAFAAFLVDDEALKDLASSMSDDASKAEVVQSFRDIGDASGGVTVQSTSESLPLRMDLAIFRRGPAVSFLLVMYSDGDQPVVGVKELAGKLDARILEALGLPPQTATPPASTPEPGSTETALPTATATEVPTVTPEPPLEAVVKASQLNLREGPGTEFPALLTLKQGDALAVVGRRGAGCAWLKVMAPGGQVGWVSAEDGRLDMPSCERLSEATYRPLSSVLARYTSAAGSGELRIENLTGMDGVVILTGSATERIAAAYVRNGDTFTLDAIPDGVYSIYFSTGQDWDGEQKQFAASVKPQRYDDPLRFTTTDTEYTTWRITLHPVADGNAAIETVAPEDFPSLK